MTESLFEFLSHQEVRAAIEHERETRHWTIGQRRDEWGDHWPLETANVTRAADAAVDWLSDALEQLRPAWNAHFDTCPAPMLHVPAPTWEHLQAWANAPSGTASAE